MANQKIDANPTKEFFISMLVRDIGLKYAIGDLVDNCIDGAKRIRGNEDYNGLYIKITLNENEFIIEDNCGGITVETATKYAFRFGRPKEMLSTEYSIGQFGIGMKRALFKIGNAFTIESSTVKDSFTMGVNVNAWKEASDWTFDFQDIKLDDAKDIAMTKTKICVTELHDDIKSAFGDLSFISELKEEIEYQNLYNINKKISIIINTIPLKAKKLNLKVSDDYKIGKQTNVYGDVEVEIIAGIGDKDLKLGGWYLFCNDRLIIGPDQTKLTGWGDGVAKYHGQYERFRGFVFFRAEDSSKLPWNTTKTGMNEDSPIFKMTRMRMIEMMKPVINGLLNSLKQENDSTYQGSKVLHKTIESTDTINLATVSDLTPFVSDTTVFSYPAPDNVHSKVPKGNNRITYTKPTNDIEKLKKFFNVTTTKEVGEKSFEYVYENEIS